MQVRYVQGWWDQVDRQGLLLDICRLVPAVLRADGELLHTVLRYLSVILSPTESSSTSPFGPKPNLHILVLRCLDILPVSLWDGRLDDSAMGVIMEGLNSPDDTIRRAVRSCHRPLSEPWLTLSRRLGY
jgi:hypothetical protein